MNHILGIIPARYASTRFPGKPLVDIRGKTMIQRVYERCQQAAQLQQVIVATDDARIAAEVERFGGAVEMTGSQHPTGTDRIGEVAARHPEATHVINIQGDEPLIEPGQIDLLAGLLLAGAKVATLVQPLHDPALLAKPEVAKVVVDHQGDALYFSRAPIPHAYGQPAAAYAYQKHLGIYGFARETLLELVQLPEVPLEQVERLEMLRWLYHGYRIRTASTGLHSPAIDTPEDLARLLADWPEEA